MRTPSACPPHDAGASRTSPSRSTRPSLDSIKDGSLVVDANYPTDDAGMDDAGTLNGELPNLTINVI